MAANDGQVGHIYLLDRHLVDFADWLHRWSGQEVDPDSIFDCQIKCIHEYKWQLLNILHIMVLYNQLRYDSHLEVPTPNLFLRRQSGASILAGQAPHQADQRRGYHHRC
jgi:glucan phosphorylase